MPYRLLSHVFLLLVVASWSAIAGNLSDIKIESFLNQPLKASIYFDHRTPLNPEEIQVRIASEELFRKAGIERLESLSEVAFQVKELDKKFEILIVTKTPIFEPYLNFLVEVSWPSGRLVKEYVVLLNMPKGQESIAADVSFGESLAIDLLTQVERPLEDNLAKTTSHSTAHFARAMRQYGPVLTSDTLWNLALRFKPPHLTITEVMEKLYESNQDYFMNGDKNRLMKDIYLNVPAEFEESSHGKTSAMLPKKEIKSGIMDASSDKNNKALIKPLESRQGVLKVVAPTPSKIEPLETQEASQPVASQQVLLKPFAQLREEAYESQKQLIQLQLELEDLLLSYQLLNTGQQREEMGAFHIALLALISAMLIFMGGLIALVIRRFSNLERQQMALGDIITKIDQSHELIIQTVQKEAFSRVAKAQKISARTESTVMSVVEKALWGIVSTDPSRDDAWRKLFEYYEGKADYVGCQRVLTALEKRQATDNKLIEELSSVKVEYQEDSELLDDSSDEVSVEGMLDLARAYVDAKSYDDATSLLLRVKEEGNPLQRIQATQMLEATKLYAV